MNDNARERDQERRDLLQGSGPVRGPAADPRGARLRRADADPGAGDPRAAQRPRRDRPGADRQRQDRRLRPADARVHRSGERGDPGDRPHPDARALHPGDPGAARVRRASGGRERGGRLRRRADPRAAVAAPARRPGGGGDGRPHDGPDLAQVPGADRGPLRRPRRGRRDARPRLHRGRREDPADVPERAPDAALLGDDAGARRTARRDLHVRPRHDPRDSEEAHRRLRRAGLRDGGAEAEARAPGGGAEGRGAGAGDHLRPHQDRRGAARAGTSRTRACASRHCMAT